MTDTRIIALSRQLCDFVEHVQATADGGTCRMSLAEAHRAHVVVDNLRPLLDQYEAAQAMERGSLEEPQQLRRWPIAERAAKARECARLIVRNTVTAAYASASRSLAASRIRFVCPVR
jgi:hypothetical protein